MKRKTKPFDPAEYLDDEDAMTAYLVEAFETDDPTFIADALGVVARARGMTQLARHTGFGRESLYKALSATGNPEFATVIGILKAFGLRLTVVKREPNAAH